jgi:hypothetical protein
MSTIAVTERQSFAGRQAMMRRVAPRRKVAIPLNVTILRSGVPDAVPGRSVDVGEGGIGAVLAADLFPGELVGVEFRLPDAGPVLAKARVCYQERLRCGLQFLSIPAEQREMLGAWTLDVPRRTMLEAPAKPVTPSQPVERADAPLPKFLADSSYRSETTPRYLKRKIFMLLAASVIVVAGVGWWQWEQGWQELESRVPGRSIEVTAQAPTAVGFEVMQRLLVHKVDPVAPAGPRIRGVAVVSAVIGRDGSVLKVLPVSGPEPLIRSALDSVQWWKFEPYRPNGVPVEVETSLAIEFR